MKVTGDLDLDRFSRNQWVWLASFAVSSFLQALVVTIEDPTYHTFVNENEVEQNNSRKLVVNVDTKTGAVALIDTDTFRESEDVSATFFGLLLLYYHLLSFILVPLIGGFVEDIGLKQVYMFGIYVAGLTPFLSGILSALRNDRSYILYSFLIRGIQAFGAVGMQVALYMMITIIFPVHLASVFAVNQAMSILGILFGGPLAYFIGTLGGFAYRARTFWTIGGIYVILALVLRAILPDLPPREAVATTIKSLMLRFVKFLTIPQILLYAYSLVVTGIGAAFLRAIMALHVLNFDLGVLARALIPLLPALLQLLSPLWGIMLDKVKLAGIIAQLGAIIVTFSLFLVGPAVFLPLNGSLFLTCCGLVIFGLGEGALIVSSYVLMMQESIDYQDLKMDPVTLTIVSTTFVGAMSAGESIGSITAPIVYEKYGFRDATLFPLILYFLLIPLFVIDRYFHPEQPTTVQELSHQIENAENQNQDERKPLLSDPDNKKALND